MLFALSRLRVTRLVTIGGDDTAFSAMKLEEHSSGRFQVIHVPKTIDNDLDLPYDIPTFGFQTARHVGAEIVKNLMVDARTTAHWYLVVTMGRKAGHLALGIGKAAGATLTIIPEEFRERPVKLQRIVDLLIGAVIKRLEHGRADGVAVLAEGLIEIIDSRDLGGLEHVERDEHGHLRMSEIDIGDVLRRELTKQLHQLGLSISLVTKNVGYELRCADPIPYDIEYTRDLGYCAAQYVLDGGTSAMVSIQNGRFTPIPFKQLVDSSTGRTKVRMVDIESQSYQIARQYMIRLTEADVNNQDVLGRYAAWQACLQRRSENGSVQSFEQHEYISSNKRISDMKILATTDGSKHGKWAIEWLAEMPFAVQPVVRVLHVVDVGIVRAPFMIQPMIVGTERYIQAE